MSDLEAKLSEALSALLEANSSLASYRSEQKQDIARIQRDAEARIEQATKIAGGEARRLKSDIDQIEKARRWQQDKFNDEITSLKAQLSVVKGERDDLSRRLDLEQTVTKGVSQSTKQLKDYIRKLEKKADYLSFHDWKVQGKEKVHDRRALVSYKCKDCSAQLYADMGGLE